MSLIAKPHSEPYLPLSALLLRIVLGILLPIPDKFAFHGQREDIPLFARVLNQTYNVR